MASFQPQPGASLSKLLLQSRGNEVLNKIKLVNAFTADGKASLPIKLVPEHNPDDEREIVLKGTETLTTVAWNIASMFRWDGAEISATAPQSALLNGGVQGEKVPIRSTGMLQLLVETTLAREEVRRLDVLEASLESIRSMLLCQRAELHLRGAPACHSPPRACGFRHQLPHLQARSHVACHRLSLRRMHLPLADCCQARAAFVHRR